MGLGLRGLSPSAAELQSNGDPACQEVESQPQMTLKPGKWLPPSCRLVSSQGAHVGFVGFPKSYASSRAQKRRSQPRLPGVTLC